jgi:mannose-6-phosphate isomerase-like protein (cupin superfamily)
MGNMSMRSLISSLAILAALIELSPAVASERTVDPSFLRASLGELAEKASDLSTSTCHYRPIFGEGAPGTSIVKSVARFGEMLVDPGGESRPVEYPREEQLYLILEGKGTLTYGSERVSLRSNDFAYLPPGIRHGLSAPSDSRCRVLVVGFKIPEGTDLHQPPKLLMSNIEDVPKQTVSGHPPSVLYRLLVGDRKSTRDKIAAGQVLTSFYIMEFEPGGTNFPHHHETEEEIYLILDGQGEMVAGGGVSGIEGRYAAKAGDAYFFRLNCTTGFYNDKTSSNSRILGIRSLFPFRTSQ